VGDAGEGPAGGVPVLLVGGVDDEVGESASCSAGEAFGEVPRCGADRVLRVGITVGRHA
jgi:hypothetical protein